MPTYTELKGMTDIGQALITEHLESSLISFFDWGLTNTNGFFNVNIPTSGQYGGDRTTLRMSNDPAYTRGKVWEGFRSNWVWESGLTCSKQPIVNSGVYVNGSFYPSNTAGAYKHYINYPEGRVVFDSAISTSSLVKVEFSYKWVSVSNGNNIPWFKELQYNSLRNDDITFLQTGSGNWNQLASTRVQMPAIVVETVPNGQSKGYALGGSQYVYREFIFHIFAENSNTASKLSDIVVNQKEKTVYLYDINKMAQDNKFPLNSRGSINAGALTYPQIVDNYAINKIYLVGAVADRGNWLNQSVYHSTVRLTAEVILGNI